MLKLLLIPMAFFAAVAFVFWMIHGSEFLGLNDWRAEALISVVVVCIPLSVGLRAGSL